ncbi:MAG: hypothetical protein PVS3B3_38830 [Ktedonobacteraceae bacterium]
MTDLSVISAVKIETIRADHTVIISTSGACTLICTLCGGLKSTTTYVGSGKDAWLNGTYTCSCNTNARNPGGDEFNRTSISPEERDLLQYLYSSRNMDELRARIPAPHLHDSYSVEFYDLLSRLHHSSSMNMAIQLMQAALPREDW